MSDTHVNAYALELQEKRTQRVVLDGEIKALEKKVETMSPDLPSPEEARAEMEPKDEDIKKTGKPEKVSTQPTKRQVKEEADSELDETNSDKSGDIAKTMEDFESHPKKSGKK